MTAPSFPGTKPVPQPTDGERVQLAPERIAELERSQTGGEPVGINAADPIAILNLVKEHGPGWLASLTAEITESESHTRELRALRDRVEAMTKGAA